MGRCGLRAPEVGYPADTHLRWSDEGEFWLVGAIDPHLENLKKRFGMLFVEIYRVRHGYPIEFPSL